MFYIVLDYLNTWNFKRIYWNIAAIGFFQALFKISKKDVSM